MAINWFPGHMVKVRKEIKENLKLVDVVIEVVDARAPESTRNKELEEMIGNKPLIRVMNKKDLVEAGDLRRWISRWNRGKQSAVTVNALSGDGVNKVMKAIEKLYQPKVQAMLDKGWRRRPPRLMVVGIPNVGKSTLLNAIIKKKMLVTGPQPGVTRGKQWVRVQDKYDFMDTPGLMWPRIENEEQGYKLALLAVLGEKAYDHIKVAAYLLEKIKSHGQGVYPGIDDLSGDGMDMLRDLAVKLRLMKNDEPDMARAARQVLNDYRQGRLVKLVLDDF